MAKRKKPAEGNTNPRAAFRKKMNMTQTEFAERCHVSRATIARFELGEPIGLQSTQCICKFLGISMDDLANLEIDYPFTQALLSPREIQKLAEGYSRLNKVGRQNVIQFIADQASINPNTGE